MARDTELFEDCRIIFRNFAGKEGQYNSEGDRNFCLLLDHDRAEKLMRDDWNVKFLKPREPDDTPQPYLQVSVGYKNRPPKIFIVTSKGRTSLGENEVEILDWVDIANIDLIINPYNWSVGGRGGVKAYVKTMAITIQEDYLELKYAEYRDLTGDAIGWRGDHDMIDAEVVDDILAIEGGR